MQNQGASCSKIIKECQAGDGRARKQARGLLSTDEAALASQALSAVSDTVQASRDCSFFSSFQWNQATELTV